jgi:ankyrin repeat protein
VPASAAGRGHDEVVKLLLGKEGIDVNFKDSGGRTPLLWAAAKGHDKVVKLLLGKEGIDVNFKDSGGRTPLYSADSYGWTPLSRAAAKGHDKVVKLLLGKEGIDVNSADSERCTPLSRAVAKGHDEVVKLLLGSDGGSGLVSGGVYDWALCRAIEMGYERLVRLLLAERLVDLNLNATDNHGRTPLWLAVENRQFKIATDLISSGADIDYKTGDGMTALHLALRRRNHDIIEFLLENSAHTKGITASEWITAYGKQASDVVQLSEEGKGKKKHVRFLAQEDIPGILAQTSTKSGTERHLLCVSHSLLYQKGRLADFDKPIRRLHLLAMVPAPRPEERLGARRIENFPPRTEQQFKS